MEVRGLVFAIVLCTACGDPPPLTIRYALTKGPGQVCYGANHAPADKCSDIAMTCDAVLSVRIVAPSDPTGPYVSLCEPVIGRKDLCSIAGINLPTPTVAIPEQPLWVQVAIFSDKQLQHDDQGKPICPTDVEYDLTTGLPVSTAGAPAIGGRGDYHPGDSETVVSLGCTDLDQLQSAALCLGSSTIDVTATVSDYKQNPVVSVDELTAAGLSLSVGEPISKTPPGGGDPFWSLAASSTAALVQTSALGWGATIDLPFGAAACLDVREDISGTTAVLTCRSVAPPITRLDFTGAYLDRGTLNKIVAAIGKTEFPSAGLVIGVVLDKSNFPVANVMITPSAGSAIEYLSADKTSVVQGATSASGIFVQEQAPFGTTYDSQGTVAASQGFGGLVNNKVTLVLVQFKDPIGN